jgi:two-component system sensor histidine kinase KdpD
MGGRVARLLLELAIAAAAVGLATAAGELLGANPTAVALVLFTLVLFLAAWRGLASGVIASLLATACLNFFFLPPLHTWAIEDQENWVALGCFLVASILAGRLVARVRREAAEAEARRRQVEALAAERERLFQEQAHLEALRESDALKTSLLRAVSHDLATPLTALALQTAQLRRHATAATLPLVEGLEEEVVRLRRRIEGLLAMARLEAGAHVPASEPTPPADLFRAARENLSPIVRSRPITVRVDADCPDLDVDPSLALEVVVNLVENAHRASPPGEPVTLLARRHPGDERMVRLEVLDQGPGIAVAPEAELEEATDEPSSDVARRGLGLEIARDLARALRGTVTLANRADGGAVAQVDLPAAALPASEET